MASLSKNSSFEKTEQLTVSEKIVGMRCDRWMQLKFPFAPPSLIHKWLRTGQMRIDGKRCKANQKLLFNQKIRIPWPARFYRQEPIIPNSKIQKENGELLNSFITGYNDSIITINKPYGLAVQGGTGIKLSLADIINCFSTVDIEDSSFKSSSNDEKLYLIHRLDKETSGVMIIARNHRSAMHFSELFRIRKVEKSYCAIIKGIPSPLTGIMATDIKQNNDNKVKSVTIHKAITQYKTICQGKLNDNSDCSLVLLKPKSGRKHQLRIHCKDSEHPILGDFKINSELKKNNHGISRLLLHSLAIEVKGTETNLNSFVEPDNDFLDIIQNLKITFPSKKEWIQHISSI